MAKDECNRPLLDGIDSHVLLISVKLVMFGLSTYSSINIISVTSLYLNISVKTRWTVLKVLFLGIRIPRCAAAVLRLSGTARAERSGERGVRCGYLNLKRHQRHREYNLQE